MRTKTKNPYFMALYKSYWTMDGYCLRYGHSVWAKAFTGSVLGKLPKMTDDDPTRSAIMTSDNGNSVEFLLTASSGRRRKHRVFCFCNKCGTFIPAGRIHQHTC